MICIRHLITSRVVTNRNIFLSEKTYFPSCVRNMFSKLPSNIGTTRYTASSILYCLDRCSTCQMRLNFKPIKKVLGSNLLKLLKTKFETLRIKYFSICLSNQILFGSLIFRFQEVFLQREMQDSNRRTYVSEAHTIV